MGIRNIVRNLREKPDHGEGRNPLALSEAAQAEIRSRIEAHEGEGSLVFFVLTQPSPIGHNVGVGFREVEEGTHTRPGFPVPVLVSEEDYDRLAGTTVDYREGAFVTFTDVAVHVSDTPNPESRKFIVNRDLVTEGSATFQRPVKDGDPQLVKLLLEIPGTRMLFLIRNFCSVTREPGADWQALTAEVGKRIQAYFAHGGAAITPPPVDEAALGEVEGKIVRILEEVIRPAVQRDGGDIAFAGYEDGVVQLYMLGSCVGCPSSMATLKMGVENLLRDQVPQVKEVMAID